jgi:hypothetical protein
MILKHGEAKKIDESLVDGAPGMTILHIGVRMLGWLRYLLCSLHMIQQLTAYA